MTLLDQTDLMIADSLEKFATAKYQADTITLELKEMDV